MEEVELEPDYPGDYWEWQRQRILHERDWDEFYRILGIL